MKFLSTKPFMGWINPIAFLFFSLILIFAAVKGQPGNPLRYQTDKNTEATGPFESSNSASRYALAEAIVLHHRFSFTESEARFAAPDLVYYKNVFQSIFTPGIALFAAPFLWIGLQFGVPQLGAYFLTIFFALMNTFLVYKLAKKLQANSVSAALGAFIFLFASNAYAYALTLTQHHGSILVLLLAMWVSLDPPSWKRAIQFGALCGIGILFDFPNIFLLFPLGLWLLYRSFSFKTLKNQLQIHFHPSVLGIVIGILPLMAFFGYYNYSLTGSPLKIGQFLGRTNYFDTVEKKEADSLAYAEKPYQPKLPFQTRIQLEGASVLAIGNERSWLFYSPVLWVGALGIYALVRQKDTQIAGVLFLSVISTNFLVYSMFGDPWGGWSFGARYLLPAVSLMSIMIAVALTRYRSWFVSLIFFGLATYSIFVNTAGALTSAAIPPKQEAKALFSPIPYTYKYNFDLLQNDHSGSLFYNYFLSKQFTALGYYGMVSGLSFLFFTTLFVIYLKWSPERK